MINSFKVKKIKKAQHHFLNHLLQTKKSMMKQAMLILVMATMIYSFGGSQCKAEAILKQTVDEKSPVSVPTSTDGFYMQAKMDGKEWVSTSMDTMDEETGRIIGYNNDESMNFHYDRRDIMVGEKLNFENKNVNLMLNDEVGLSVSLKGKMISTRVDEKSAEGTFRILFQKNK